jgi:hypothetical protein
VFLLPSLKLKQKSRRGKSHEDVVHDFLMKRFSGYTASAGNIFGYWRDDTTGSESYGEHKEYKVSFRGRNRVAMLKEFLSELARELDEDSIYLEYGEDAWLVYARTPSSLSARARPRASRGSARWRPRSGRK